LIGILLSAITPDLTKEDVSELLIRSKLNSKGPGDFVSGEKFSRIESGDIRLID
jgi:hypothetical protein